ncbi:hypothetical protein CXB51_017507 [Gossypium anomalum]|uniref:Uncharacterized protein n=1 Tax=Gossypium anomalum TaxID=47600 RepID=A0A8J6D104_9ROSI|nr:hypothetical protein CXB51_017507 [Gossypium anomalum]
MEEEKGTIGSINLSLNVGIEIDGLPVKEAHFRGRKLQGTTISLPNGYAGFVLAKNNSGKRKACDVSEGNSNDWEMKAKFDFSIDSPLLYLHRHMLSSILKEDPRYVLGFSFLFFSFSFHFIFTILISTVNVHDLISVCIFFLFIG